MKLLLDECLDHRLLRHFPEHEVLSAKRAKLTGIQNGRMLDAAQKSGFDVLITVDKSLSYQNKVAKYSLSVIVVRANSNRLLDVLPFVGEIKEALKRIKKGQVIVVGETETKP